MATESFTNSNGVELTTHSANWANANALNSDFVIDTNALRTPFNRAVTLAAYYTGSFADDQYAEATLSQVGSALQRMGVAVRCSSGNCYAFYADVDGWGLAKLVGFSFTSLDGGSRTQSNGDTLYLSAVGTTLTAKINGTTVSTVTDSSHTSGNPGVSGVGEAASGTYTLLDSWTGADIVATVPQFFQYAWPHQLHARR